MSAYLFDTNIWLRAVQRESPHHMLAVNALAAVLARGDVIHMTAQNLIEFWSVASRPTEANGLGWPVATVRQEIDRLLAQFPLLEETPAIFAHWRQLVTDHHITGRRVHDARLVAEFLDGCLALMPDFLDRVLGRIVRRKVDAGDRPRRRVEAAIHRLEEGGYLRPLVPAGIVPTDRELGVGIAGAEFDQKIRRVVTLGIGIRHQMHLARQRIQGTVEGLAGFGIDHIKRQPFVPLAPPIATNIAPMQKTLIKEQQYPPALVEVVLMRRHATTKDKGWSSLQPF